MEDDDDLSEDSFLLSPSSIEANERDKRREEEQQQKKKVAKSKATTTGKRGKENEKRRNDAKEPETVENEQRTSTRSTQTYPDEDSFDLSYGGFRSSPPKATPNKRTPTTPSSSKGKEKEVFSREQPSEEDQEERLQQYSSIEEEKGRGRHWKGGKKPGTKRKTRQEEGFTRGRTSDEYHHPPPPSKGRRRKGPPKEKRSQKNIIPRAQSSEDETIAPRRKRKRDDEAPREGPSVTIARRKEKHDDARTPSFSPSLYIAGKVFANPFPSAEKAYQRIKPIAFWRRERIVYGTGKQRSGDARSDPFVSFCFRFNPLPPSSAFSPSPSCRTRRIRDKEGHTDGCAPAKTGARGRAERKNRRSEGQEAENERAFVREKKENAGRGGGDYTQTGQTSTNLDAPLCRSINDPKV